MPSLWSGLHMTKTNVDTAGLRAGPTVISAVTLWVSKVKPCCEDAAEVRLSAAYHS